MVLKKFLAKSLIFISALISIWAIINSLTFIWEILHPAEGTLSVLMIFRILFFLFTILLSIGGGIYFIMSEWFELSENLKYIAFIPLAILFISLFQFIPEIFIRSDYKGGLKSKERLDEYIINQEYLEALEYAEEMLSNAKSRFKQPSKFFTFNYFYFQNEKARSRRNTRLYYANFNLGYCLAQMRTDLNKAEEHLKWAVTINRDSLVSDKDLDILPNLYLTGVYINQNNRVKAEKQFNYLYNIDIKDKEAQVFVSQFLSLDYATFLERNGDVSRAIQIRKESFEVLKANVNQADLLVPFLMVEAKDLLLLGQPEKAEDALNQVEGLRRKFFGLVKNWKFDEFYSFSKLKLELLIQQKKYFEAISIAEDVVNVTNDKFGNGSPIFAESLITKARLEILANDPLLGKEDAFKAKSILEPIKAEVPIQYAWATLLTGVAEFRLGNPEVSFGLAKDLSFFLLQLQESLFPTYTQSEKEFFISQVSQFHDVLNSIYLSLKLEGYSGQIYNNLLTIKGAAIQSRLEIEKLISKDSLLFKEYNDLQSDKTILANQQASGLGNERIAILSNALSLRERSIYNRLDQISNRTNWQEIRDNLDDNELAIEIFKAIHLDTRSEKYYAAILANQYNEPLIIELGFVDSLKSIIGQTGRTKDRVEQIYSPSNALRLKDMIWSPMEEYTQSANKIYLSRTDVLNQLAYSALPIKERNRIVNVFSSRQILDLTNEGVEKDSVFLFGDVDYVDVKKDSSSVDRFSLNNLPFTKNELDSITKTLIKFGYAYESFTGLKATEENIKKINPKNKGAILHIASHGFYLSNDESYQFQVLLEGVNNENPMLRSGIILSDFMIQSEESNEDGVMTALEFSNLNLSNVQLTVLSACESGLGDIVQGEGIFGLQRALRIAGVKSQIVSMWKVPDKQTSELMSSFYKYYLEGISVERSLHLAQEEIKSIYESPFYWAGFMVIH